MTVGTTLPAITLWQPHAFAVARLGKLFENRPWYTPYRGPIAIHAGLRWDTNAEDFPPLVEAWKKFVRELPPMNCHHGPLRKETAWVEFGAVVAVADLFDVCTAWRFPGPACGCGPWAVPYQDHWKLDNVRHLQTPVPCRGRQRLWKMPDDVEAKVRAQL